MRDDRSLASKYRPKRFEDIVGQEELKTILERQIKEDKLKSAYLLFGKAGTGKTTTARCLARSLNGGTLNGLIEVDAASNSGVDNVREIIENSKYKAIGCSKKVYIIDEAHVLSSQSWQVFLKTIEDGVDNVIFIFCTTEKHKVPATIISRCQVFDLRVISSKDIRDRLKYIQEKELEELCEISGNDVLEGEYPNLSEDCLDYIAKLADGGMRLAISYYEKVIDYSYNPTVDEVSKILGTASYHRMFDILDLVYDRDSSKLVNLIEGLHSEGCDFKLIIKDFVDFVIELIKYELTGNYELTNIPAYYINGRDSYGKDFLLEVMDSTLGCTSEVKRVDNPKNYVLGKLLQLC